MTTPKSRNPTWQVLALVFTSIATLFSMTASAQTSGTIFNYAGVYAKAGYSGDGGPANKALLSEPLYVVHDSLGNIYFFDAENSVIRVVNAKTGVISTFAGNGQSPPNSTAALPGDGGPALSAVIYASGLAFDAADTAKQRDYSLAGACDAAGGASQTVGWAVAFDPPDPPLPGEPPNEPSTCAWSGQWRTVARDDDDMEYIETSWYLTTGTTDRDDDWEATQSGKNYFFRSLPTPKMLGMAILP